VTIKKFVSDLRQIGACLWVYLTTVVGIVYALIYCWI